MPDGTQYTPEELAAFKRRLQEFLATAPEAIRSATIINVARKLGPEVTQSLLVPEGVEQTYETPDVSAADIQVPAAPVPWYAKPFEFVAKQPVGKQLFQGLSWMHENVQEPLAMMVTAGWQGLIPGEQDLERRIREAGVNPLNPWGMPREVRTEIWNQTKLPWGVHTLTEAAFDPLSYIGWGIPGRIGGLATKAGLTGVAKVMKPLAVAESAYARAVEAPFRLAGKAAAKFPPIQSGISIAGKPRTLGALFQESAKSRVSNESGRIFDALNAMTRAGKQVGKTPAQILDEIRVTKRIDPRIRGVLNDAQKQATERLLKNADKLDLETFVRVADDYPERVALVLGTKSEGLLAGELGVKAIRPKLTGPIGFLRSGYDLWKRAVLFTPFYVVQQLAENPFRLILSGMNPLDEWATFVARGQIDDATMKMLAKHPVDIQRRVISLGDRWNQTIPKNAPQSAMARNAATGGATEATIGALATGKRWPNLTVAAWADDNAINKLYFKVYREFKQSLAEKAGPQFQSMQVRLNKLFDTAKAGGQIDDFTLESLRDIALRGDKDEVIRAFSTLDSDPYLILSKAMTDAEKGLPESVRMRVGAEISRLMAAGDKAGVDRLFDEVRRTLPRRIQEYQKQVMVQRLGIYRRLIRESARKESTKKLMTKVLDSFRYDRMAEAEAKILNAKSVGEFQTALFNASVESRREMEALAAGVMLTEAASGRLDDATLALWFSGAEEINQKAFAAGGDLLEKTWKISKSIKGAGKKATTSNTVRQRWDAYIMEIQDDFPYWAEAMRNSPADADLLWSAYRGVQEQRWFKVGQEKLRLMGLPDDSLPSIVLPPEEIPLGIDPPMRSLWDDTLENNALRMMPNKSSAGATVAYHLEAGGDLIREIAGGMGAPDYIAEKLTRLKRFANTPADWKMTLTPQEQSTLVDIVARIDALPENTEFASSIKQALKSIATQDRDGLIAVLPKLEEAVGKVKPHSGPRPSPTPRLLTMEDFLHDQTMALEGWKKRVDDTWAQTQTQRTSKQHALAQLREESTRLKESTALMDEQMHNQASEMALDYTYTTFGNYGKRTTFDDIMSTISPFWFFPSRSIPYYARQMVLKPKLGMEILTLQNKADRDNSPDRLFGSFRIPMTNYYYNPLRSLMLWQLWGERDFTPTNLPPLESGIRWMNQNMGISFGPQINIATALAARVIGKHGMEEAYIPEPQGIIPQARWLKAVEGLKLPVISPIAGIFNEPLDAFMRGVYGDDVAQWQKREVEKYLVDAGVNPMEATESQISDAWQRYHKRQLVSIPFGAVREFPRIERERYDFIEAKKKEMGFSQAQINAFKRANESPFTGLRQDQIQTIYADMPASDMWKYIRPVGLTARTAPNWEQYVQMKWEIEAARGDPENPADDSRIGVQRKLDAALISGQLSPDDWRDLRRQNYQRYADRVEQIKRDFPKAMKSDEEWEAFRNALGWDSPIRHPDDLALDAYYDTLDSSLFENAIGQFDYDTYQQAREAFFQQVSKETAEYIQSRSNRYKTPLELAYSRDMQTIRPYWDIQDLIMRQLTPEQQQTLEFYMNTSYEIQRAMAMGNPYLLLVARQIRRLRDIYKRSNPKVAAALDFWYG